MGGGFHGKYELALYESQLPHLLQQLIISGAVVSEVECLADDLAILSDDDGFVTPFGNVNPDNEHSVGTCLSC